MVISITLVFSTCPPVSVWGTGTRILPRGFSWRHGVGDSPAFRPAGIAPRRNGLSDLPGSPGYMLTPGRPSPGYPLAFLVPPSVITDATWYGNINPLAIGYAFRPRLRSRLTLSRRTLLRKPWTIGGGDSHPSFVTHAGILTSRTSTAGLRRRFTDSRTLSYRVRRSEDRRTPAASVTSLSPVEFSALEHLTSELLRILSRMAASKPTSWLSVHSNIVSHLAST